MRNKFDITVETNNQAEGYNYAVGSNKLNSKHSNSFTNSSVEYYVQICIDASEIEILILLIFLITFLQKYVMCVYLC